MVSPEIVVLSVFMTPWTNPASIHRATSRACAWTSRAIKATTTVTITLKEEKGKTRLVLEHSGWKIPPIDPEVAGAIEDPAAFEMHRDRFWIEDTGGFEAAGNVAVMIAKHRRRQV